MGSYIPNTPEEQLDMLKSIGYNSIDDLFISIPDEVKIDKLNIPEGKSELEVREIIKAMASKNKVYSSIFRGAGAYNHYIPSIVKSIVSKEEFITSYTPYQAEISQGLLQSVFEYQTMICELTGMDVSNASVYDGATAAAEAMAMCRDKKRQKVLISETVNPMVKQTIETYCIGSDTEFAFIPSNGGVTDIEKLSEMLDETIAGVYIQQPNFYGLLEDDEQITKIVKKAKAKIVIGINPITAAIIKPPGEIGADIAVGEGQPLGMPLAFGGPYLGFMSCKKDLMRKLPGRIVGQTVDTEGKRAFVLTLQAREQHIRRERASSNICSNQALCAMTAGAYMAAMGANGIRQAAELSLSKAHYAAKEISSISGFNLRYGGEFFNEFVTECPISTDELIKALSERNILGGYPVDDGILWCVTEMNSKEQIDNLAKNIREVSGQ